MALNGRGANDEHVVVVNTGPPSDLSALNELWRGFHPSGRVQMVRNEDDMPERRLAALGISPDDVDHLVITPLVGYTLGSLELFKNAVVHLYAPRLDRGRLRPALRRACAAQHLSAP